MTSMLSDRILFEVDIQRCDSIKALIILPTEVTLLQDQSLAKDPVEVLCLNPTPIQVKLFNFLVLKTIKFFISLTN